MGLFSKKKKVPEFPQLPEKPSYPEYQPQLAPKPFRIKIPEIIPEMDEEELNIPIRRPVMPRPTPIPIRELAPTIPESRGSQPLFVKIEKYKAAINSLNEIKQKITEAEDTLAKLNAIKIRESDEIARWESELRNIKEKLIAIDNNLFEV